MKRIKEVTHSGFLVRNFTKKILQIQEINKILQYVKDNSLVFFDVDETLIIPKTQFIYGIPHSELFMKKLNKNFSPQEVSQILKRMEEEYYKSKVELVEDNVMEVLNTLEMKHGCEIFGLTARGWNEQYTTQFLKNLKDLKLEFSILIPDYHDPNFEFKKGILFVNHQDKGDVLKKFLTKSFENQEKDIYFIDDLFENCTQVYRKFQDSPFKIHVFHYIGSYSKITEKEMEIQLKNIIDNNFNRN